jgi:hypothetical protein
MKKLICCTLIPASLIILATACALTQPQAEVEITSTSVGTYSVNDWYIDVAYTIHNDGIFNISYYEITFEVTCTDNTKVTDWDFGYDLARGESHSEIWRIDTGSYQPDTVQVSGLELEAE